MALGTIDQDTKRKVFLSITHGKVVHYLPGGGVECFKNVEGNLQDITIKERTFNGKATPFLIIFLGLFRWFRQNLCLCILFRRK